MPCLGGDRAAYFRSEEGGIGAAMTERTIARIRMINDKGRIDLGRFCGRYPELTSTQGSAII